MRSRSWALAVLVLATAALGAACSDPVPPGPDAGVVVCAADGDACTADVGCCSFNCKGGACGGVINDCIEDNLACISNLECCSALCTNDGYCGIPGGPGTCVFEDQPCLHDADCCSNTCTGGSAGVCTVGPNGCTDDYETCTQSIDCCSQVYNRGGVCARSW